jgi:hypothetical protein
VPVPASKATLRYGMLALSVCLLAGAAEAPPPLEYQVKAAFLLNFTKFIDWPQSESAAPFDICLVGDDPFGAVLDQMVEGETFQGRKLAVQRVRRPVPAACHVLFIAKSEKDVEGLLSSLGPGVLTVGEESGFLHAGGMIGFVIAERRVRFDINEGASARAGLRISSKLLSIARSVEK